MDRLPVPLTIFSLCALLLGACAPAAAPATPTAAPPAPAAAIANPASVFCTDHGGKLEIITAADGSQSGRCALPDGTKCDEWAFFRGECGPAARETALTPGKDDPAAAARAGNLAVQQLAAALKVDPANVRVSSTEKVTWPDACLGLPAADEACAQVETPGFRVLLTAGDQHYSYRTDYAANTIRQETAAAPGGSK